MDYKKKYEEALARARQCYSDRVKQVVRDTVSYIFYSEFKESEDERIRKALVDYFNDANKSDENPLMQYGIQTDKVITWLEKLGNKNSQVKLPIFTFEDVLALECATKIAKITKGGDELYKKLVPLYDKIHNAYLDEKQGEEKQGKSAFEAVKEEKN